MYIVWSKPMCPQCDEAKAILRNKQIQYEERVIGQGWTKEQLLEQVPHARSVPQIFANDEYVGGVSQLRKLMS